MENMGNKAVSASGSERPSLRGSFTLATCEMSCSGICVVQFGYWLAAGGSLEPEYSYGITGITYACVQIYLEPEASPVE